MTKPEAAGQTQASVTVMCRAWQKLLRLEDWDITIEVVRSVDMDADNSLACITRFDRKRRAYIQILDPRDFRSSSLGRHIDIEVSIVHELLHIYTRGLMPRRSKRHHRAAEEQMIHAMSTALVELARANVDPFQIRSGRRSDPPF